jgi:FlaG/FlaF family flagellin (archaellin)
MDPRRPLPGISPVIATMLLVGMTVLLSALVYLLVLAAPQAGIDPSRLQYIHVLAIRHEGDPFSPNCDDSCILLIHEGNAPLENDALSAIILRNSERLPANITTLNAYHFYSTKHNGVDHLWGPGSEGSKGSRWDPGEEIFIDLNDHSVKAGDLVTVRIIDKTTDLVISEDTARA